ncbi:hypothetical protein D9M70_603230 [compost metagenome]
MKLMSGDILRKLEIARSNFFRTKQHIDCFAADFRHLPLLLLNKPNIALKGTLYIMLSEKCTILDCSLPEQSNEA